MQLATKLLQSVPEIKVISGWDDTLVAGISADSRVIQPQWIFAAVDGVHQKGSDFVPQSIERGASAILCAPESRITLPEGVMRLEAVNVRHALAALAAAFYAPFPRHITSITGTDGKTSTADFVRQLWQAVGQSSASVGTLGVRCDALDAQGESIRFPNTTPDPVILAQALGKMAAAGVQHMAMEASSHGLHQYRLDGVVPRVAVFTTFGHDHGDYHPTFDDYFDAKARLFRELLPHNGLAVLNADDARIAALAQECRARGQQVVTFGRAPDATFRIVEARAVEGGQEVELLLDGVRWAGCIPLYGAFQVMNVLAAVAAIWRDVEQKQRLLDALTQLQGVAGRLERICMLPNNHVPVFTDYAHTPDALANVLRSLRPHVVNKLWVVFGCGGDRDTTKRPLMGAVAKDLADMSIVTDDNPRSEEPAAIRAAILAAHPLAVEMGSRVDAIAYAMHHAQEGDVVLVAGKGHERTQTIGKVEHYHHDGESILEIAAKMQQ
jgi:UDP-N-acetylmuramoyl-L-alanyl-D-glutamate--2,6-diaminopimelate ligase